MPYLHTLTENDQMESINYQLTNGVAHITLNRPEKYNAFIREMAMTIQGYLAEAARDDAIRCILISAKGKAFCAGQDLSEISEGSNLTVTRIVDEHFNPMVRMMAELRKPIVCSVQGVAAGAGANLALACDIVIAGRSASFMQAFSKIGLIPDTGGTFYLPRLVGLQKAMALMMLADKISAEEAERISMIYKVVDDEKLEEESWAIANKLAAMPTKALGLIKQALNRSMTNDLDKQIQIESQLQTAASNTLDFKEGVAAFLEKRAPNFTGQ